MDDLKSNFDFPQQYSIFLVSDKLEGQPPDVLLVNQTVSLPGPAAVRE